MADPFLGEIRPWALNFAPQGWAFCNGQLMSIQQNSALFALLGTTYGGDGRTTFALPDLRGRVPMHFGNKAGLTPRTLGEKTGSENVTLSLDQTTSHTHKLMASTTADTPDAVGAILSSASVEGPRGPEPFSAYAPPATLTSMANQAIQSTGGGQPHPNMQPYLPINMCIALMGIFPPRS